MRKAPSLGGLIIALSTLSTAVHAQPNALPAQPAETAAKLSQRITTSLAEKRLEDIFAFVKASTGVRLDPLWTTPQHAAGLDREAVISIVAEGLTVTEFIDRVLDLSPHQAGDAPTWQLTSAGILQIGPRSRLNRYKRIEIYDVKDILKETPNHGKAPTIDLQQALQPRSASPLRDDTGGEDTPEKRIQRAQSLDELAQLIRDLIEPEQWNENGGDGSSMKLYQGLLIVSAPDYIQRQISTVTHRGRETPK